MSFTWSPVSLGDIILAVTANEVKTNTDTLTTNLGVPTYPGWSELPVSTGEKITKDQVDELQDALDYVDDENYCHTYWATRYNSDCASHDTGIDVTKYNTVDLSKDTAVLSSENSTVDANQHTGYDSTQNSGVLNNYNITVDVDQHGGVDSAFYTTYLNDHNTGVNNNRHTNHQATNDSGEDGGKYTGDDSSYLTSDNPSYDSSELESHDGTERGYNFSSWDATDYTIENEVRYTSATTCGAQNVVINSEHE